MSNDAFADAYPIEGAIDSPVTVTGSTVGFGREMFESGGAYSSAWYKWIAPADSPMYIDTQGSDYDTYLGVWTGDGTTDTVSSILLVTQNDDSVGLTSACAFQATAGQTYYFQVGGYSDGTTVAQGNYTLNLTPNPLTLEGIALTITSVEGEIDVASLFAHLDSASYSEPFVIADLSNQPNPGQLSTTVSTQTHIEATLVVTRYLSIPLIGDLAQELAPIGGPVILTGAQSTTDRLSVLSPYYI